MARLHEYQGKALLRERGIDTPRGFVIRDASEARDVVAELGGRAVMKVQAWITGRKDKGGVIFIDDPAQAHDAAAKLLTLTFGSFPVTEVLIEELIDIKDELFVSFSIDDAAQSPVLLLNASGGTGIEDRAQHVARIPISVNNGPDRDQLTHTLAVSRIDPSLHKPIIETIVKLFEIAHDLEARSLEVNPLVTTKDGRVLAADCRITIDDYAVFRHPEIGIEIARELDHPATELEHQAYEIENADHRGTFYFAQLPTENAGNSGGVIGFHGAGGGGSMMSMDAVTNEGFTLANFCDTSGNPSAAKVYRAARIILAQPGLVGYFGSGSGVASQEQYWSAYGLAKAFLELDMHIPAVIRLGGNSEDRAVEILEDVGRHLPGEIEGYKKDDTPAFCAQRFRILVEEAGAHAVPMQRSIPSFVDSPTSYSFPISGGRVWIDHPNCHGETAQLVIENSFGLLNLDQEGRPVLAVSEEDVAGKDSEFITCEIECFRAGKRVVFVDLPIPLLDEAHESAA